MRSSLSRARDGLCALLLVALWLLHTRTYTPFPSTQSKPQSLNSSLHELAPALWHQACPLINVDLERERAAHLTCDHPSAHRAAIAILAQAGPHSTYGRDSAVGLARTLELLYLHYNDRFHNDIWIFHAGEGLSLATQQTLARDRPEIRFYHLQGDEWRVFPFHMQGYKDTDVVPTWKTYSSVGYRKMIRFFAKVLPDVMHRLGYTWVLRLDDDSSILSPIPYNLFTFMETHGLTYAYRNIARESGWSGELWWQYVRKYVQNNRVRPQWLTKYCVRRGRPGRFSHEDCGGEAINFYSNFFVLNVTRWLDADIQHFVSDVDDRGVMFTKRWGDLLVQSAAVQMFVSERQVHRFLGWGYAHNSLSFDSLNYGIVQGGALEEGGGAVDVRAYARHHNWSAHTVQGMFLLNGSIPTLAYPSCHVYDGGYRGPGCLC